MLHLELIYSPVRSVSRVLGTYLLFGDTLAAFGAIFTVISVALVVGGVVMKAINSWRKQADEEEKIDKRIVTTLFGRDAEEPYPKIEGLVESHAELAQTVALLHPRVDELETNINAIGNKVSTLIESTQELIERTQENGGSSIKDQMNRIERYILDQKNGNK